MSRESGFFVRQDVPEAPGRGRASKMRAIAAGDQVLAVEGHPVDPTEASTVVAVYDALSGPEARHALMSPLRVAKVLEYAKRLSGVLPARRSA